MQAWLKDYFEKNLILEPNVGYYVLGVSTDGLASRTDTPFARPSQDFTYASRHLQSTTYPCPC